MVNPTQKTTTKGKKTRGRQSDFSGEKESYLLGLTKEFDTRKDRGAFYDEAAQGLIDRFGYSRDGRVYVGAETLSAEEKLDYYKGLRSVSVRGKFNGNKVLTRPFARNWGSGFDIDAWGNHPTAPTLPR